LARKPLIVGNWKMNLSVADSTAYTTKLKRKLAPVKGVEVVVCPSFLALPAVAASLAKTDIAVGAQNVFHKEQGAFTGEIAASQLEGLATHVIVGHSERRIYLDETNRMIAAKLATCHLHGLTPILCIGETLHDYDEGLSSRVINDQLTAALRDLDAEEVSRTVIVYEPVWAVGTGKPCTPRMAAQMIDGVRRVIASLYSPEAAEAARILYGGSVTHLNADVYLDLQGCDGLLVGHASLELTDFTGIVRVAAGEEVPA
jgi:triosephosphate isomerase (TIM)